MDKTKTPKDLMNAAKRELLTIANGDMVGVIDAGIAVIAANAIKAIDERFAALEACHTSGVLHKWKSDLTETVRCVDCGARKS